MLLEVKLINWRPFEIIDPPAQFTSGVNFIYGENGAGKSSFLDAIMYGLYGNLPYNLANAVRRGKNYSKVELKIKGLDDKEYRIRRAVRVRQSRKGERKGYTDSKSTEIQFPDGTTLKGSEEVTKQITSVLGVSDRIFSEALYLRQGELRDIVLRTGRRRAEYLDKLIGTIDLENCYRACGELISWADGKINTYLILSKNLKEDVARLPDIQIEAKKLKVNSKALRNRIKQLNQAKEDIKREKKELKTLKDRMEKKETLLKIETANFEKFCNELEHFEELFKEIRAAETEIENLSSELEKVPELDKNRQLKKERLEKLLKEFVAPEKLKVRTDELRLDIGKKSKRIENLRMKKTKLDSILKEIGNLDGIETQYVSENKRYLDVRDTLTKLDTELKQLRKTFKNLTKYKGGKCPTCLQDVKSKYADLLAKKLEKEISITKTDLTNKKSLLQNLEEKVEKLKTEKERLKTQSSLIENLRTDVEHIEEEIAELDRLKNNLKDFIKQFQATEKQTEIIEKEKEELDKLEKEIDRLRRSEGQLEELNKKTRMKTKVQKKIDKLSPQIAASRQKREELVKDLEELEEKFKAKRFEELEDLLQNNEKEIRETEKKQSQLDGELKKTREEIANLKDKEKKLRDSEKSLEKWRRTHVQVRIIRQAFRGAQPILRQQFLDSINVEAQQIFMDIKRKKRLEGLEITSDYDMNVTEGGRKYPIDQYSGGEKTLIALVFRTALAKALAGDIPLLIYDEPTEYLDKGHRENLVNWLSEWGEIRQIVVVSQLDDFHAVADNVKEVQMRGDGTSGIL